MTVTNTMTTPSNENFILLGKYHFYAETVIIGAQTKLYEQGISTGEIHRALEGAEPGIVTIETRVLPQDRRYFADMVLDLAGKILPSITAGGIALTDAVMTKGTMSWSNQNFTGKCVLVFKKM